MKRISVIVIILMMAFSVNAFAKIGVVSFQEILKQSESGKDVYNKLQTAADDYDKKLQVLGDKIKAMQDEYAQKESVYKPETKEKKRTDIQREIRNFNTTKEDYSKELKRLEMRHLKRVQDEVLKIVQDLGKELGYEVILEEQNSAVLYRADTVDITENVIKRYDNVFKQGK
ncbi:MAG: OmpH family outer membrane protein [Deferribacterales bacterium]|jgi:outer membrane protein